jgi:hypothetical protein
LRNQSYLLGCTPITSALPEKTAVSTFWFASISGGHILTLRAIRQAPDPETARRVIADTLPPELVSVLPLEQLDLIGCHSGLPPGRRRCRWWRLAVAGRRGSGTRRIVVHAKQERCTNLASEGDLNCCIHWSVACSDPAGLKRSLVRLHQACDGILQESPQEERW